MGTVSIWFIMMAVPRLGSLLRIISNSSSLSSHHLATSSSLLQYFYTRKHEYVKLEGNTGTIGVSQHAADALGDVVYAQLPDPGTSLEVGEECGAVESVKAASEIYSPVSGTVTLKNEAVENGPALINANPLTEGWLFKLELQNLDDVKNLMDSAAYEKYLEEQE